MIGSVDLARAARRAGTAPVSAGLLLLLCYVALTSLTDPSGYLGTDTGTKVYTLEVMSETDSFSPDIGYWAEEQDPGGGLHPVHQTRRQSDGSWVGVTTLPMLQLARPLYELGGYRATLVLPMLGGVAAAFAARHLARRLDPSVSGWSAFWVIGLGSPILVYSLDFWEHTVGVACVLWAVVVLLGVLEGRPAWTAAIAGALFGAGAVMRQEVLVYTLVAVAATAGVLLAKTRALVRPVVIGLSTVAGFAVPWYLNGLLESATQGQSRASRSSGTAAAAASSASASKVAERFEEGLQTLVGLVAGDPVFSVLLGAAVVGALLAALRAEGRGDRTFAVVGLSAAASVYLADALGGLGFIPGLFVAFPLAAGALVVWNRGAHLRVVLAMAAGALPLVYAFQYLGGAPPQWGGRYTLASGSLFGIVALVGLRGHRPLVRRGVIAMSFLVTAFGFGWLVERSHGADDFFQQVVADAEPVVIARQAFLLREGGATLVGRRWLSVEDEQEFTRAVDLARSIGEERFTVLEWEEPAPPEAALPADVREVERFELSFVNTPVGMVTYEFIDR